LGVMMVTDAKSELEHEISELRRKIDELGSFKDDPKIQKIITAFRNQIARYTYRLSHLL
jgi:hypothetical protein